MVFNSVQKATGSVGKGKQRIIISAILLVAVGLVAFIVTGTDTKKKRGAKQVALASNAANPSSASTVSQYQMNLGQSVTSYQQHANNGASMQPYGQQPASSILPGSGYGNYTADVKPNPQAQANQPYMQGATIPPTAYNQPGYAPPQPLPVAGAVGAQRNTHIGATSALEQHDELARERQKRAYEARYGTSVAKSIRAASGQTIPTSGNQTTTNAQMPTPGQQQWPIGLGGQIAEMVRSAISAQGGNSVQRGDHNESANSVTKEPPAKSKHPEREPGTFMLPEGTTVDTVLQTRLNGSFAGPAKVMVTQPVYDRARKIILIPAGSIFIGDVRSTQKLGESRLAITFHRLLRTDGYSKDLDTFTGLNQIGETALKDKIDHHYLEILGVSVALGGVAGLAQMRTNYGYSTSGSDMYRQGFSQSLDSSAQRILDRYTNILPTLTIREGTRVKVYLTNDIYLPPSIEKPILD